MASDEFDVVVLGSGAGGLTAAVAAAEGGARVGVFEKADALGGTTAWSGGMVWIPNNPHMPDVDATDSRDQALAYIMSLSHGLIDRTLAETFVDTGPEMVRFLEERTPVQFYAVRGMPDYHPEFPGGLPGGGRTIECPLFPFEQLGPWAEMVTPSPYLAGNIVMSETPLGSATPKPPSAEELARRQRTNERGCGQALIGRLLKACLDRGIEPRTSFCGRDLLVDDGAVVGVRLEGSQGQVEIRARLGVVLATGGFEWNPEYVRAFLRGPMTHPVSIPTSTGDGLRMAMKAGAMLGNMREAWWMPAANVPIEDSSMGRQLISGQRSLPRSIMVNRDGKRFTNESANYNAFGGAFHVIDVARFELPEHPVAGSCSTTATSSASASAAASEFREPSPTGSPAATRWATWPSSLGIAPEALEATRRAMERRRGRGARSRVPSRRERARPLVGRSEPQGSTSTAVLGPLDRPPFYAVGDPSRRAGHQGRAGGRRRRARARHRRRAHPRPLRRRQRHGFALRHDLWRPGRNARTGDGVRFPGRATCGGARRGPRRQLDRRGAGREVVDDDVDKQRRLAYMARVRELAAARRFGERDRLGTANLLDAESRRRAAASVRHGISLCMARPLVPHQIVRGRPGMALETRFRDLGETKVVFDHVELDCHGHVSTHLDALNHIGLDGTLYAGWSPDEHAALGVDGPVAQGLLTRGLVADIPALRGTEWVAADEPVTGDELEAALAQAQVQVQPGDALLIYMGRDRYELAEGELAASVAAGDPAPGVGAAGAEWIANQPFSMLAWDFLDAVHPSEPMLAVHLLIWAIGLLIIDNCDFSAALPVLRERGVCDGLFTVGALSLAGATGQQRDTTPGGVSGRPTPPRFCAST